MTQTLLIVQIVLAIFLSISVLLQHRGTSLGGAFGGGGEVYRSRRGAEKFLFYFTVILATLFVILAIINLLV
ncbi:MAG TPA: preprotein translocase subunit SecG [Patescibacteria group bacterium]|nr:preprotein translocase subunit SecG [Patescibacteria group bacterium]